MISPFLYITYSFKVGGLCTAVFVLPKVVFLLAIKIHFAILHLLETATDDNPFEK